MFTLQNYSSWAANSLNINIMICKSGFLDFVHHLYFNKITAFWKLDLLPSSGKKKGRTKTPAVGPPGREDPASETFRNFIEI
jgi:hypothetical protein